MAFGGDKGRFHENKRAVKEKDFGPLIKTFMTRCIQCTRCVRFSTEIAGVPELGATGRGENMEIGTYIEKALSSEMSGNMIDLCPVGALTNKPASFTYRSWELKKTETVDVMDAVGSNIRVDVKGRTVIRVLPRVNDYVNEEWISDKSRFACDALQRQRLDTPYVRKDGRLQPAGWAEAFAVVSERLGRASGNRVAAIAGDMVDVEAMTALKDLMDALGSQNYDCRQDGAKIDPSVRASYLFNSTIAGIDEADALLLIGTNPRKEAAVINTRIRKRWRKGGFQVGVVGPKAELAYRHQHLGESADVLEQIAAGTHPFAEVLKAAKKPMLILGQGALTRSDAAVIQGLARKIAETTGMVGEGWNGYNMLHTAAARVGGLDIGFVPGPGGRDVAGILDGAAKGEIEVVWLLGADEIDMAKLGSAFVIYQGHHGDAGAMRADVILPGAAYTEKNATYVNTEGRVQEGKLAVFPPGEAKEDWKIIRALSEQLGKKLPYDSLSQVRARMGAINPVFNRVDAITPAAWAPFGGEGGLSAEPLASSVQNFYMTDPISRASKVMAECTATYVAVQQGKTGTHG